MCQSVAKGGELMKEIAIEISPGVELMLSREEARALQYKLQLAMESTSAEACSVTYGDVQEYCVQKDRV